MTATLVVAGALPVSSCWFGRKRQPPPPAPIPVSLPADARPPQRIEQPPDLIVPEPPKTEPPQIPAPSVKPPDAQEPVERTQRPRRNTRPSAAPAQAQQPAAPAPVPAPAQAAPEPPKLAAVVSDEQRRVYDAAIEQFLSRAAQNLARARARGGGAAKELIERAESFMAQARAIRRSDPAAAKGLAERAELVSREALR